MSGVPDSTDSELALSQTMPELSEITQHQQCLRKRGNFLKTGMSQAPLILKGRRISADSALAVSKTVQDVSGV
jgi:hypothetical protein